MPTVTPRYLVPFHPKRVPHFFTDVLIIGGGLAGMRAALAVDPQLSVLIITKDQLWESNSAQAQGGIAGAVDPDDSCADHVADTLDGGRVVVRPRGRRAGRRRGPAANRRTDRLGDKVRRSRREARPGTRGRTRPRPHRPRPGRRHRQGDHPRGRRPRWRARRTSRCGTTPSPSTC